jgi:hypothetical protein
VQTPEARKHATAMLRYVAFYFGPTPYGHERFGGDERSLGYPSSTP